jgi:hypothetical protein
MLKSRYLSWTEKVKIYKTIYKVMYGCETWSMTEDRVILNTWERNILRKVCTKNIMGFAETKLSKNHGKHTKHLIWLRIFNGKS